MKNDDASQRLQDLERLHAEIDHCTRCKDYVSGFCKPRTMARGLDGRILIVGQGPGRTEMRTLRAFSGQSGKRLDTWLVASGADPSEPRRYVYTTSVVKCVSADARDFETMARRCAPFLARQIVILRPRLVISLGEKAYRRLALSRAPFAKTMGTIQAPEAVIATPYGTPYVLMVWPHPSGLNRLLNDRSNQRRLELSFAIVRQTALLEHS